MANHKELKAACDGSDARNSNNPYRRRNTGEAPLAQPSLTSKIPIQSRLPIDSQGKTSCAALPSRCCGGGDLNVSWSLATLCSVVS